MRLWEAVAFALLAAALSLLLREAKSPLAVLVPLLAGVVLLGATLLRISPLWSLWSSLSSYGLSESASLVLRVLGIGYLGELGAELCRDMGAGGLGTRLEMLASAEILLACLPTLSTLLEGALALLS